MTFRLHSVPVQDRFYRDVFEQSEAGNLSKFTSSTNYCLFICLIDNLFDKIFVYLYDLLQYFIWKPAICQNEAKKYLQLKLSTARKVL